MATEGATGETNWPLRSWVLVILGALTALAIQQLSDMPDHGSEWGKRLVSAVILFLGIGTTAFGLAWQKPRPVAAIIVAILCGSVAGAVFLWNGVPDDLFGSVGWHLFCGLIAAAFFLTLFQAAQDGGTGQPASWSLSGLQAWRHEAIHYPQVHGHLWTNALLLGLSALFAGLTVGIAHLLAEMFWLVKLGFLRELLRESWFLALLVGAGLGGGMGLLRDRGPVISTLQRVAMLVLRVLAPVLALGILGFLAALPFTGLAPLWDTGGTTPIMLAGAMIALFLANAVVDDSAQDESRSIVLASSAAALGLFLLPMVGIAAFSSGLRIQQHGLSPDRLWALTFIIVASITAVAYAVAILSARGWFARLRRANLHLVYVLAIITLLLSTPLIGFERIATAHQLARLRSGQVSPVVFDYRALWFSYGPPGKAAIRRLAAESPNPVIRRYARAVTSLKSVWDIPLNAGPDLAGASLDRRLTILPRTVPLEAGLRQRLVNENACGSRGDCVVHYVPPQDYAVVVAGRPPRCNGCSETIHLLKRDKGKWFVDNSFSIAENDIAGKKSAAESDIAAKIAAIRAGKVEMRPVQQRQLFIDGKPAGSPMPLENATAP